MSGQRRNIEIKAQCSDIDALRASAVEAGAEPVGVQLQTDTYFRVDEGRLKLRRIEGERTELISYRRSDRKDPKTSYYSVKAVRFPGLLRWWLSTRHGILVEVSKRREIWLWRGVRIHLDEVRDLGSYMELEAVVSDIGNEDKANERCRRMMDILKIKPDQLLDKSYSDMLLESSAGKTGD